MVKIIEEIRRILPILLVMIVAVVIVKDFSQFAIQIYSLSMVALSLIAFHFIRQALFPYVNLKFFTDKALESSIGAAIVFFSIILFIVALIIVAKF